MEKATAAISFRTMLKEVETEQQGAEVALDAGSALNIRATPQYSGSDVTADPLCRISLESYSRAWRGCFAQRCSSRSI